MRLSFRLNGKQVETDVRPDMLLLDLVRDLGCYSVKRGCETANCGLCTVLMDNTPVLSCSVLAARADGHEIYTLEGLQEEAAEFVGFIADQGERGRRIWYVFSKRRRRAVWFLQSRLYYERSCYGKRVKRSR